MTPAPASRLLRGWLAAAVSTLFASASHWAASDSALFSFGSLISFALAGLVCVGLAGRELTLGRLTIAVISAQAGFHTLLGAFGTTTMLGAAHHGTSGAAPALASGHDHTAVPLPGSHGQYSSHALPSSHTMSGAMDAVALPVDAGQLMLVSHVCAAAATVVVLRRGELALRFLAELALALVVRLALPAPVPALMTPGPRPVLGSPKPLTDLQLVLSGPGRRGPPVLALAA